MTLKQRIEDSAVVFFLGALVAGFVAGIGAYKAVIEIAQLEVVSKQELGDLRAKAKSGANLTESELRVGLTRFPEVESFAALLRQNGYLVDLVPAGEDSKRGQRPRALPREGDVTLGLDRHRDDWPDLCSRCCRCHFGRHHLATSTVASSRWRVRSRYSTPAMSVG